MPVIKSAAAPACRTFSMTDIEQEAAALLRAARQQSAALLEEARQQAEQGRQQAYEEGHRLGRADGHADGLREGREEGRRQAYEEHSARLPQVLDALEAALKQLEADREALAAGAADEVAQLALALATRVCKRAALFDPQVCAGNVIAALRLVLRSQEIRLHVNPLDRADIERVLPDIGRGLPALRHVEIVDDPQVGRGGCRVATEGGLVDADLDVQLERLAAELVAGDEERPGPQGGVEGS